jgi:hypothetical protein
MKITNSIIQNYKNKNYKNKNYENKKITIRSNHRLFIIYI